MTETPPDDTKSKDRNARKDAWEVSNKALNTLMVAHGAGLAACVTLLKDYKDTPQLKGSGLFIVLFGLGLVAAIIAAGLLLILRTQYLRGPGSHESNFRPMVRWSIGLVLVSVGLLLFALLLAVYKFSTLEAQTNPVAANGTERTTMTTFAYVGANWSNIIASLAFVLSMITLWQQRKHNRLTVRPLAYIEVGDYGNWVFVRVVNNGTGPMIIKSITVNDARKPLYEALPNPREWGVYWRHVAVVHTADRSVPAGGKLLLVDLSSANNKKVSEAAFAQARDAIRCALGAITVRVEYTDIYNKNQPVATRALKDVFHRQTGLNTPQIEPAEHEQS